MVTVEGREMVMVLRGGGGSERGPERASGEGGLGGTQSEVDSGGNKTHGGKGEGGELVCHYPGVGPSLPPSSSTVSSPE